MKVHSISGLILVCMLAIWGGTAFANEARIAPYSANPRYWQYGDEPVLLLGGSKTDHLFLLDDLERHLDEIAAAGGNYVRNTMSQREGPELKPYRLLPDGRFDLDQWNDEYWRRFENCLNLCRDREIIVQIELWDRFDYSREEWAGSPWRPANNVNYTTEESGFADEYPAPAYRDKQPFFFTVPGVPGYDPRLDRIRTYQEQFALKLLSYSLAYGNVLYCIENEGSAPPAWGRHWAGLIREKAAAAGIEVHVTDMYDQCQFEPVVTHPEVYSFIEGSKILGPRRQPWAPKGEAQWRMTVDLQSALGGTPHPINAVKIITNQDDELPAYSVRKFWRGLFGGMAAIRFHRAPAGLALEEPAKACIRAARTMESMVKLWDTEPRNDLLRDREEDEAYLRANPGERYAVYLPQGGSVGLDLSELSGAFSGKWIDIRTGDWGDAISTNAPGVAQLVAPDNGPWACVLTRGAAH